MNTLKSVNLTVVCSGSSDQTVTLHYLTIEVNDINDNAPSFAMSDVTFELSENLEPGLARLEIEAYDPDSHENGVIAEYYFSPPSDEFMIVYDSLSSVHYITNSRPLDFEHLNSYELCVLARDSGGLLSTSPLRVKINVVDQNEYRPEFIQLEVLL